MEMSPQAVRSTGFKIVKKGYDPNEVDAFKEQVAGAVEYAQNQATAMEARARAAVAKLQEVSQQVAAAPAPSPAAPPVAAPAGDAEVISRTLLLAQRTADQTVADAKDEADKIVAKAREEAGRVLDSSRTMAAKTVDDARFEARKAAEDERVKAENEVQALLARRDFLLGDVEHLEQYLQAQRERLRDAAVQLHELIDRVPGGLGDMRRPLLSASAEPLPADLSPVPSREPSPAPAPPVAAEEPADEPVDEDATQLIDATPHEASTRPDDTGEHVWRMLDEEVARRDSTGELPLLAPPSAKLDPFKIDDEDLQ